MKKVYTMFKLFVATVLISFAGKANAAVTADDLVGTYSFTADFVLDSNHELAELLTGSFTFEIYKDEQGYYAVRNFAMEGQRTYFSLEEGILKFNSAELSSGVDFADEKGSYPYEWPDMYYPTWSVDGEGNITIPDFTVVECDYANKLTTIVAKYSNCQVTKTAGKPEDPKDDAVNFAGTYTVTGTKMDYSNGIPPTSGEGTFTLSIDEDGLVTEIAGYEVTELANWGYVIKGKTEGSKFVISVENAALTLGAEYDVLGDGNSVWSGAYDSEGTIELSLKDGEYSITDFSVWSCSWSTEGLAYAIKYYWTGMAVAKEGGEDVEPEPAVNVAGTYTVTGTKFDYTNGTPPTSDEQATFTLSIDEDGNVYEIAGYEVPDVYGAQGVYGKISENSFVISPVANSSLSLGMVFDKLGDDSANAYNDEGSITLNYSNGAWTMSDFSVWQFDWSTSEYTLKYYWTGLTVTKTSDTVSISSIAPEATAKANDGKFIENGKIVIVRNGVKYNVNGVAIK